MASLTTPIWGRPYPAETDLPDVAADLHSLALSLETVPLYPATAVTSRTGIAGETVVVSPSQTLALPASPTKGDTIQVEAANNVTGTTPVTVTASGGKVMNGVGLINASSFLLGAPNASATVQYDGTNWRMIAGQQDTGWVVLAPASGWVTGYSTPQMRLIGDRVYARGSVQNTTGAGSTAPLGTIGAPYAPSATRFCVGTASILGGSMSPVGIQITSSGAVTCSSIANNSYLTLDDVGYSV